MTQLMKRIKKQYVKSKTFQYLSENNKVVNKMLKIKDILFFVYTISFILFFIAYFMPIRFYFYLFGHEFIAKYFILIDNLVMLFFALFLFSFSIFLIIYFKLKKYNKYLYFLDNED